MVSQFACDEGRCPAQLHHADHYWRISLNAGPMAPSVEQHHTTIHPASGSGAQDCQKVHENASLPLHNLIFQPPNVRLAQPGCLYHTLIGHQIPSGRRNGFRARFATNFSLPTHHAVHLALTCHAMIGFYSITIVLVMVGVRPDYMTGVNSTALFALVGRNRRCYTLWRSVH